MTKERAILMLIGLLFIGLLFIGIGCWLFSPPAAMIAVGSIIILDAIWDRAPRTPQPNHHQPHSDIDR